MSEQRECVSAIMSRETVIVTETVIETERL